MHTASSREFKGVIAEAGFTSIEDMRNFRIEHDDMGNAIANAVRDFVYNSLKIHQKFDNNNKINLIKSPILILHAKADTVTPYEMSVKLAKLKPEAKTFFPTEGGHSITGWQDTAILEFLKTL